MDIHFLAALTPTRQPGCWLSPCGRCGHGEHESLLAADAFFEGGGVKIDTIAHLGDAEFDGADAGVEEPGVGAIGRTETSFATLIRLSL